MQVCVFGNPDLQMDSLPVRLIPELTATFPLHTFVTLDPNEEWDISETLLVIDTVVGIETIMVFQNLTDFLQTPRVTCHDFDAYTNLQFMMKLGKVKAVTIIGIPPKIAEERALLEVTQVLHTYLD